MQVTCLRIKDWQKHFENNRTRELKKLDWVPIPNKHDGDGFTELLEHPNGVAHYGAWMLLVQIASKCDEIAPGCGGRGTLLREGVKPHTSQSLARISHSSAGIFDEAIPRLLDIGWLERITIEHEDITQIPQEGATIPQEGAASRARAEGKGREGKGTEGKGREGPPPVAARGDGINGVQYPLPDFGALPKPLYASTAKRLLEAVETQVAEVKRLAAEKRIPVMDRTAEGTEYRKGWRYPSEAANALQAWDKRKAQINAALAGTK